MDDSTQALVDAVAAPLQVVEDPDEVGAEDEVVLTRQGWLRCQLGDGVRLRLRRPFMGELRTLRLFLESLEDEVSDVSDRARERADALGVEYETAAPADKAAKAREVQRASRLVAREVTEAAEACRIRWWRKAVDLLGVDATLPEDDGELPAWMGDALFPHRVLQHWRSVPLGRG